MLRAGDQIPLQLQLWDGSTSKFPRAFVNDATGASISGSPFDLSHVANGQYSNLTAVMPSTPFVTLQFIVYSDAGRTIVDLNYSYAFEIQELENSLPSASYTAPDNASVATILTRTDVATSTRLASASYTTPPTVVAIRTEIDSNSTKLDVAVSTRLASAGYTAPDNSSITAIKAKTDNLPASPANEVTVAAVKAKTDNLPASPANETSLAAIKANTDLIPATL